MNTAVVAAFLAAAVPSFFTPGPNNLMLMTSSAKFGLGRTVPHALGIVFGFPLMVLLIGLGLGELFVHFPVIETVLRYLAAGYLLWMAWHLLGLKIADTAGSERPMRFHEAVLFQWINPKAWAMATSFVVLVVVPGAGHATSLAVLVAGCLAIAPLSTVTWMGFGHQLEAFLRRTGGERLLGPILAALMVVAVVLFLI